jgi:hypothetical protein
MLRVCACCSTRCAADLACCPHCGATDLHEEGDDMAKITTNNGPTHSPKAGPPEGFIGMWGEHEHPGTGEPMEAVEMEVGEDGVARGALTDDDGNVVLEASVTVERAPETPEDEEAEGALSSNDAGPDAEPVAAAPQRPATNATKADWIAYVEALSGEDVDGLTKTQLIELADQLEAQADGEG